MQRFQARYKNRNPDPGICQVISIDWEERKISMSNGACRYFPSFDEVIIEPVTEAPEMLPHPLQTALVFAARYTHHRGTGGTLAVVTALKGSWHLLDETTRRDILEESKEATYNQDDWETLRKFAAAGIPAESTPKFTIAEIADYIAGWTTGPFGEVAEKAKAIYHNALNQLEDDQDGIAATASRRAWTERQTPPNR